MADDIVNKINKMTESSSFTGERIDVANKLTDAILPALKKAMKTAKQAVKKANEITEGPAFRSPVLQTIEQRKYQKPIVNKKAKADEAVMSNEQADAVIEDAKAAESINDSTIPVDEQQPINEINQDFTPDNVTENIVATPEDSIDDAAKQIKAQQIKQPTTPSLESQMATEPVITPEQLGAGIKKAEQEISDILETSQVTATGKAEKLLPPSQVFNLASQGDLAPALKAISDMAGIETKKVNFADLTQEFEARGFPSDFIGNLTSGRLDVSPETSLQILNAEKWSSSVLDDIGRKVLRGEATDAEMYDSVKAISFNSLLLRSIKGYKTNLAQSFAALGIKIEPGTLFESSLDGLRTKDDLLNFFSKREDIKANKDLTETQKAKVLLEMNDAAAVGSFIDRGITSYLSGMISGFGTLARVIGGDAPRLALRPLNTLGASFYGALRNTDLLGGKFNVGSANRRYATESLSQILSIDKGFENGIHAAVFAWKEGFSALDASATNRMGLKTRPDFIDIDPDVNPIGQAVMKGFNWISSYGSRSVMTASEFMKGIHYQMGMDALATRRGIEARDLARSFNKTEDEQWDAYQAAARDVYLNPPEDVLKEAKYWTLEARPEKGSMSDWLMKKMDVNNIPVPGVGAALDRFIRVKFPFMFTTTNDMVQSLEHTPLSAAWMATKGLGSGIATFAEGSDKIFDFSNRMKAVAKKIREDINSGDYVKRDMALAKITTGTAITSYFVGLAADGKITGAGPRDKVERQKWMAQGAKPFSFVIQDEEGLTDAQRLAVAEANFGSAYKYSLGSGEYAGKVYVSYNGMSTFAALASIGATLHESSQYLDSDDYTGMAHAGVLGMAEYVMDYPMLTGISSMIKGYQDTKNSPESGGKKVLNESAKWLVNVMGGMAVPASAQRRYWSKQLDDTQVEFPIDPDMTPGISGFMAGWNEQMNGLFQNTGSNRITMWGDEIKYDDPNAILSTSVGKSEKAEQIRILSGAATAKPSKTYQGSADIYIDDQVRTVDFSVPFSDAEYKTMLILANAPIEDGGYDLKNKMIELEYDGNFINGTADNRKAHVESIMSAAYKSARDDLYLNDKIYNSDKLQKRVDEAHKTLKVRADAKLKEIQKPMTRR